MNHSEIPVKFPVVSGGHSNRVKIKSIHAKHRPFGHGHTDRQNLDTRPSNSNIKEWLLWSTVSNDRYRRPWQIFANRYINYTGLPKRIRDRMTRRQTRSGCGFFHLVGCFASHSKKEYGWKVPHFDRNRRPQTKKNLQITPIAGEYPCMENPEFNEYVVHFIEFEYKYAYSFTSVRLI